MFMARSVILTGAMRASRQYSRLNISAIDPIRGYSGDNNACQLDLREELSLVWMKKPRTAIIDPKSVCMLVGYTAKLCKVLAYKLGK